MTKHPENHRKLWLENLVKSNNFTSGAELGVQEGVTFKHLIENCPDLTLHGVDIWGESSEYKKYRQDVLEYAKSNPRAIIHYKKTTQAVHDIKNESLDFVFIDADHSYSAVKGDIKLWEAKVKRGGYICGHDIDMPDVKRAVVEKRGKDYQTGPDAIWYYIKE